MDLSISERTRTLPGLKLSNPYDKLWSVGQDDMAVPSQVSLNWDRPLSVPPPELQEARPPSHESFGPIGPDRLDPSPTPGQGNITIPRPHGRKTPEPGKALAPPVAQPRSKPGETGGDGGTTAGRQEFRQALGMTTSGDLLKPTKVNEVDDDVDLLSLLDPLNSSSQTSSASAGEGGDAVGSTSSSLSSSKPTLPPRPYPQGLPPLPTQPHISLNPFAQTLPPYTSPHRHYSPAIGGNPFGTGVYGPPTASYFHTPPPHPLSTLPGLYRQPSPGSTATLPPGLSPLRPTFPASPLTHSSASNHALSSLLDSPTAPSPAPKVLPKPLHAEGDSSKQTQDPFGDLLAMAKPATPPKKKADDLRMRWETFD